jgi:hypothetical protein
MSGTPRGFSFLSGTLGLFQSRPKKVSRTETKRGGAKALTRTRKNGRSGRTGQVKDNPYQAAEIEYDPDCACDAVKRIAGKRFLVSKVPTIPMPDCDQSECKCTYVRYRDRRHWSADRRSFYSLQTEIYRSEGGEDRRKKEDRRVSEESVASRHLDASLEDFESWYNK